MDINDLSIPLKIDQIDFRVQSVNKGGYATILAYKDARVDMQRLDDVVGPMGWRREHTNGNNNCIISIWCENKKQWVSKEDVGTESYTEKEKGLASDSFKRSGFNWGIGRELYDYPLISVKLNKDEWELYKDPKGFERARGTYKLRPGSWTWFSQFNNGKISYLGAKDGNSLRFQWGQFSKDCDTQEAKQPVSTADQYTTKTDRHNSALNKHLLSIALVKDYISETDLSAATEAWYEIEEEDRDAIYALPPTKGGVLTTEEREIMKTTEWRLAHHPEATTIQNQEMLKHTNQ